MTTLVHKTVGVKRIKQICDEFGLTTKDAQIIDQILEEWKNLLGNLDQKVLVAIQKTEGNPRREDIMAALLKINLEFAQKRGRPDANC